MSSFRDKVTNALDRGPLKGKLGADPHYDTARQYSDKPRVPFPTTKKHPSDFGPPPKRNISPSNSSTDRLDKYNNNNNLESRASSSSISQLSESRSEPHKTNPGPPPKTSLPSVNARTTISPDPPARLPPRPSTYSNTLGLRASQASADISSYTSKQSVDPRRIVAKDLKARTLRPPQEPEEPEHNEIPDIYEPKCKQSIKTNLPSLFSSTSPPPPSRSNLHQQQPPPPPPRSSLPSPTPPPPPSRRTITYSIVKSNTDKSASDSKSNQIQGTEPRKWIVPESSVPNKTLPIPKISPNTQPVFNQMRTFPTKNPIPDHIPPKPKTKFEDRPEDSPRFPVNLTNPAADSETDNEVPISIKDRIKKLSLASQAQSDAIPTKPSHIKRFPNTSEIKNKSDVAMPPVKPIPSTKASIKEASANIDNFTPCSPTTSIANERVKSLPTKNIINERTPPEVPRNTKPKQMKSVNFEWYSRSPQARDLDFTGFQNASSNQIKNLSDSLIASLSGRKDVNFSSSYQYFGPEGSKDYTVEINIIYVPDLSRSTIKYTYNEADPSSTFNVTQTHLAPPNLLTEQDLIRLSGEYGCHVYQFAETHKGQTVGRGECWDLADQALKSIPGALPSHGVNHGHIIYEKIGAREPIWAADNMIRIGDILQFENCRFESYNPSSRVSSTSLAGSPDHTAIVKSYDPESSIVSTLEQNSGGRRYVVENTYSIRDLKAGTLRCFRPVGLYWLQT